MVKKHIQRPKNWQDFESLCKKLWGEIWKIQDTIKKNGRAGQPQSGVDIYGIPSGQMSYWGIQCKGKDDFLKSKLTREEIDQEINKALSFNPPLAGFIFATTASKDVAIEEYIRLKDIENRTSGGFQILLFCWEDIEDLIEENRDTYNYYINQEQFAAKYDLQVSFEDSSNEYKLFPVYKRIIKTYFVNESALFKTLNNFNRAQSKNQFMIPMLGIAGDKRLTKSWCKVGVIMNNTGTKVIEDWKITFKFNKEQYKDILDSVKPIILNNISLNSAHDCLIYTPFRDNPLVQKNKKQINFFIQPLAENSVIDIQWEILARDFNKSGTLKLIVNPKFIESQEMIYTDDVRLAAHEEIILEESDKYLKIE